MELLLILVGGLVFAWVFHRVGTRPRGPSAYEHLEPPSTSIINMARIRVSGVAGLGMVAMSIVVAAFVPGIRLSMAIAFGLGLVLAGVLIALRRRRGPLPSVTDRESSHLLDTRI